jgi:predicted secreted hydrolase
MGKLIAFILTVAFASTLLADAKDEDSTFGRGFSAQNKQDIGEKPNPNYVLSFPKDHYSHDNFDIEWWYLTANLEDQQGNTYGLQWTLFRFRNPAGLPRESNEIEQQANTSVTNWNNEHFYMAHASVHSESAHWFSETLARGNVGNAGIEQSPFSLYIDEWQWKNNLTTSAAEPQLDSLGLLPATLKFNAQLINSNDSETQKQQIDVTLNLINTGPYVLQGNKGYSIKSADGQHASHYYSAPFIQAEGQFVFSSDAATVVNNTTEDTKPHALAGHKNMTLVQGNAWFDQEWTSQLFDSATLGWDWLSLHLDNGDKIMAFRMRLENQSDYVTGTYINANGESQHLLPNEMSLIPLKSTKVGNKTLPLQWALNIPTKNLSINIQSEKDDQWNPALVAYYEGVVAVTGSHFGKGFLELTGY